MYSTTAIIKNSKFSGRIVGTHQQLDKASRHLLSKFLKRTQFFPSSKEIIYFEGTRGPDGLKRKSPGIDEPSHMLNNTPSEKLGHECLDDRSVLTMIIDHHWNLVQALKKPDHVRAAFEAAWMAHMITDGLTPAHHFPLSTIKEQLMTDKEMVRVFGEPIKGIMHGRNMLETMRNNWLYWGAKGHMTQHIAYEYGVAMIVAALPEKEIMPQMNKNDLICTDIEKIFYNSLDFIQRLNIYERFRSDGWTTELALETKNILLPTIIRTIVQGWHSAIVDAYQIQNTIKKEYKNVKN